MCIYYYPSRPGWPLINPNIPLPTTPNIPLPTTPNIPLPTTPNIPLPTTPNIPLPTTPNIPLPTTPNIPLPQSTGNDWFYFLLPSGQIIKRTILSVSPIEKYKWKVQFIDSQEIVIINNKEDYLALRKMLDPSVSE